MYARDQLTQLGASSSTCYVFNTKPIASLWEHWVVIYILANWTAMYFDCFCYPSLRACICHKVSTKKHATKWSYSSKVIQNPFIDECGKYFLVFSSHFHHLENLRRFLGFFRLWSVRKRSSNIKSLQQKLIVSNLHDFLMSLFFPSCRALSLYYRIFCNRQ